MPMCLIESDLGPLVCISRSVAFARSPELVLRTLSASAQSVPVSSLWQDRFWQSLPSALRRDSLTLGKCFQRPLGGNRAWPRGFAAWIGMWRQPVPTPAAWRTALLLEPRAIRALVARLRQLCGYEGPAWSRDGQAPATC